MGLITAETVDMVTKALGVVMVSNTLLSLERLMVIVPVFCAMFSLNVMAKLLVKDTLVAPFVGVRLTKVGGATSAVVNCHVPAFENPA